MKILMMTNSYFPRVGGIEQSIRSFSDEFEKLGHEVLIAAPTFDGPAEDEQRVIRIPALQNVNKTEFSINLPVPGIVSKLKAFAPDIIHSHHPFFIGDFALRISSQYRIPLVFTHHIMFEKYVHYLPFINDEKAKRFVIEIASGYANLAHYVLAPSRSVYDLLLERGVRTPMDIIPTGINLKHFISGDGKKFREHNQIPWDAPVIGYAGRLAPEKNLDLLIKCLIELLQKEPRAHVLMVGHGSSEKMIRDVFQKSGLEKRLHLTGFLYNAELVDAYFAMDVFAFASLSETQGMVLIEAMAAGVPVVAIESAGVREVVKDFFNGRLLRDPDQQKFVEALLWVLNRPPRELENMKHRARKTALGYSIDFCAGRMLRIYEDLLNKEVAHGPEAYSSWSRLTERLKAEWHIFSNLLEAGEAAILEKSSEPSREGH